MGHLDKLDISNRVIVSTNRLKKFETVEYRREKLIANIEEQIELVNLKLLNKPIELNRKRGHQVITVRPRLWWRITPDGEVYSEFRYNKISLNLAAKGRTISVKSLKRLPAAYRVVISAIRAGELDDAIDNASRKSKA
jgi:hypothetical protein